MFDGFERQQVETSAGVVINALVGGSGPPLLLLHGCPQTSAMWHAVAPRLAGAFRVVASDLRGYGDSSKPEGASDHANYAFRAMALDQVELMRALGHGTFAVAGHDRGARVAHRMALDHPDVLRKAALLDILPTLTLYEHADRDFAQAYWEWFFFTQPGGFPEAVLAADPERFLRHELGDLVERGVITAEAFAEYLRCLQGERAMHGMCEDYRAGASIDLEHDRADLGRRVACPLLVLWGERNPIWRRFDMLAVWRERAESVTGQPLPCGHYVAEEEPAATAELLQAFLA